MIKVKHLDSSCNESQEAFLTSCPSGMQRYHELLFTYGNITYRYHQMAANFDPTITEWNEWLEGLPGVIQKDMEKKGFESCKTMLSFKRYVLEKNDQGLEQYAADHMGTDYQEYQSIILHS